MKLPACTAAIVIASTLSSVQGAYVRYCIEADYTEPCGVTVDPPQGRCINLGNRFIDSITSLDTGDVSICNFFRELDCRDSASLHVTGPIPDLALYGWDNVIKSFRC